MTVYNRIQIDLLEQANTKLYLALASNNETNMKSAMTFVVDYIPFVVDKAMAITKKIKNNKGEYNLHPASVNLLFGSNITDNALGYFYAVGGLLEEIYPKTLSVTSTATLYYNQKPFEPSAVIYKEDKGELKVADLLSVAGYAAKIAEAISPNERTEAANAAITVFKGVELALNNEKQDKPINKLLHLANDFLTSVVKNHIKDDEGKPGVTATSVLVDMVIDFFVKG